MNRYYFNVICYPCIDWNGSDYLRQSNVTAATLHAARRKVMDQFLAAGEFVRVLKLVKERALK